METAKAANAPATLGSKSKAAAETSSQVCCCGYNEAKKTTIHTYIPQVVRAAKQLAANIDDRSTQAQLIDKAKTVNAASMDMLGAAQTVADDPATRDHKVALAQAAKVCCCCLLTVVSLLLLLLLSV
jgi:hypothetical protein